MDAQLWEQLGLYDPLDPASGERLALLEYLAERGATIEQMVEAHRMGTLQVSRAIWSYRAGRRWRP